jgi:hypothetical protein
MAQSEQVPMAVAPRAAENLPGLQLEQVPAAVAPTAPENLPASQLVQTDVDVIAAEYLPAPHAVQGPPPGPLVPAVHLQSSTAVLP